MFNTIPYRLFHTPLNDKVYHQGLYSLLINNRCISNLTRNLADFNRKLPKRITSKHNQKTLGSYPVPPEQEMLWKNRRTIPGGYYQQSISPFQLKFCYPLIHQAPARIWAKLSQTFWWIIWPTFMAIIIFNTLEYLYVAAKRRRNFE